MTRRAGFPGPPPPALRAELERYQERYLETCTENCITPLQHPELLAMRDAVWASSAFVAQSCISHPELLDDLCASGDLYIAYSADSHARRLHAALAHCHDEASLAFALRRERRREMMRIAWRDLTGWSDLETTLRETSWLAEAAIDGTLAKLQLWEEDIHGTPRDGNGNAVGMAVIGMGKLGAFELNFSSDVDLIFVYAAEGETRGKRQRISNEEFFARLGRKLIAAIGQRDIEGFVFRVDMRLRPWGDAGPLAMSLAQMEDYYQIQGREWERYAMIKARPVGGDYETGNALLRMLRPFVYRKYLDYGVFESLREMKAIIDREAARRDRIDDIKRGPGGIREIEFIGQTYQLIRGGREPALRERGILKILSLLAGAGHLPASSCTELADSYRFLRRLENRLQIYNDAQLHRLPDGAIDRARLAWTMGYNDVDEFENTLDQHRQRVRAHFDHIFTDARASSAEKNTRSGPDYDMLWNASAPRQGQGSDEGFATTFGVEGVRRLAALRDSYVYRALSAGGRARMDRLMPLLLAAVASGENPGITLPRVLDLIEHIARRTAYLALLADNPVALAQMVRLCAGSPWIARMLGEQPLLLDELLNPDILERPLERSALEHDLAERLAAAGENDLEEQMEALRQFKQTGVLRVAAADLSGRMPLMIVSDHLTDIAEVCLHKVLHLAVAHTIRRDAKARQAIDRGFAIIAYGKLAGIELGYGSDLDIVFLHSGTGSDAAARCYPRLGQRIIHMLSAHTPAGILYPVDLRLRPSGASGLLVSSIEAFEDYQRNHAWTWEHQALVRARVVAQTESPAGADTVAEHFTALRREILSRSRDPQLLRREIRDMRERMKHELDRSGHGRFDLKQGAGGIADLEFIVQFAVLRWAGEYPALLRWTDNMRLLETLQNVGLLSREEAQTMMDAYRAYRARIHRLALQESSDTLAADDEFTAEREAVIALWRRLLEEPDGAMK
ncbi:MAG: bifunctional [glutamate--ammonia ligase]-adenylyl-L-tyrosine phosphorylase/[glutamate--ammonia-ligase] adenylyltransferase [Chromatiales bacterium]|jgi:glutamate-ammonia-ligase adenylyltransferase|nr:bifunctional [glutamate--ammonia ligase]-adenylyl-L-tyrosine phosphorylase/[glutamate--ammonia-ligase] adenylyltransferase [Chromatiales bacterium]